MRVNPKYLLLVSDALIPLLGFFVWNWSLYFILLFYFIDLLAAEVITHLKTKKMYEAQGLKNTSKWIKQGLLSGIVLILVLASAHVAVWFLAPNIDFLKEIVLFWNYEELGIQQGYLLVPLVTYAAYAQYKMQFLAPGKAKTVLMDTLWKKHIIAFILMLAGAVATILVCVIVPLPEVIVVLGIVASAALYSYFRGPA